MASGLKKQMVAIVTGALAVIFFAAGISKLAGLNFQVELFNSSACRTGCC